jgi:Fe-S cluster assembly ATP-binding protein
VEIPGVNNVYLLKAALNAVRKHRGEQELDAMEFLKLVREKMKLVKVREDLMSRAVNEGFSGGEKKRNEVFQMAILEPKLAILDETDSGLDIDALKTVSENYIVPDHVHVLADGRIIKSGGKDLALKLEAEGYDRVREEAAVA